MCGHERVQILSKAAPSAWMLLLFKTTTPSRNVLQYPHSFVAFLSHWTHDSCTQTFSMAQSRVRNNFWPPWMSVPLRMLDVFRLHLSLENAQSQNVFALVSIHRCSSIISTQLSLFLFWSTNVHGCQKLLPYSK